MPHASTLPSTLEAGKGTGQGVRSKDNTAIYFLTAHGKKKTFLLARNFFL